MGVLNLTPDSFSGDGLSLDTDAAVVQARSFAAQGADIIDIGGESTRPNGQAVSADEEIKRVIPAIEILAGELSVPISIDTYKASVARRAAAAGAGMINDVCGLRQDAGLARVAAEAGLPLVLTSNQRDNPANQRGNPAADIISEVISDLERAIRQAIATGVPRENIIIDPGIGFGKSLQQNLEIMRRLAELKQLDRPILLGTSRKSMIGLVLDLPVEKRLLGTAATVAIGIANGADIVRVHDVKQMREVSRMSDAIVRGAE
jgi:dihydropteroate synthase